MAKSKKRLPQQGPLSTQELHESLKEILLEWVSEVTGITCKVMYRTGAVGVTFLTQNHIITVEQSKVVHNMMASLNTQLKPHNHCALRTTKGMHLRPDDCWLIQPTKPKKTKATRQGART